MTFTDIGPGRAKYSFCNILTAPKTNLLNYIEQNNINQTEIDKIDQQKIDQNKFSHH